MKVETAKNNQPERKDSPDYNSDQFIYQSGSESQIPGSVSNSSSFASILYEVSKQSEKDDDLQPGKKEDSLKESSKSSKSSESKDELKADQTSKDHEHEEVGERDSHKHDNDDGSQKDNSGNNSSFFAGTNYYPNLYPASPNSIPAARAFLHTADLERIVSAIRTESFNESRQVTIALKHSVLDGLQIRLSISENGKLKAEFLALNEQIRKQLKARKSEFVDIFGNRGVKLKDIDFLLKSEEESGKS